MTRSDDGKFARLRKIRGQLLRRPRSGRVQVVAKGRGSWIGWVELKTEQVDEPAMQHTAVVIRDVAADVLGVVEADNRPVLRMFSDALLTGLGVPPYEQVMRLGACVDLQPLVHPPFQHRNVHMRPTKDGK